MNAAKTNFPYTCLAPHCTGVTHSRCATWSCASIVSAAEKSVPVSECVPSIAGKSGSGSSLNFCIICCDLRIQFSTIIESRRFLLRATVSSSCIAPCGVMLPCAVCAAGGPGVPCCPGA